MSPLALSLLVVGLLLAVNLIAAVGVRALFQLRRWREARAAPVVGEAVAALIGTPDARLAPPRGRTQRELLREELLQAAALLTGAEHARLGQAFVELGYAREAERELERSRYPMHRVRAAEAIGEMCLEQSTPSLLLGLDDPDPLVRLACAHALARIGDRDALLPIVQAIATDDQGPNPAAATEMLLAYGPAAAEDLVGLLGRDLELEPPVRRLIAVVLGEQRALTAVPALLRCLEDEDDELVARAAHALGKIGDPNCGRALVNLARGSRPWFVRVAAANACGRLGKPTLARPLTVPLRSPNWYVRNAAAGALVELGEAGLVAVSLRVTSLDPTAIAHYWGLLDVAGGTAEVIERAAGGNWGLHLLVVAAREAGATARLEELAEEDSAAGAYAREVLSLEPAAVAQGV